MATPQSTRAPARRRPTGARLPAGADGYPTGRYLEDVEALLAGYADGGFVVGDEGRILLWSPGAERILGYAAREMIGSPCRDLFVRGTADEADRCDRPCAVVACTMAGGRLSSFEAQARTKAGDPVWLHLSIAAAVGANGSAMTVHLFRDVTENHRLAAILRGAASHLPRALEPAPPITRREIDLLRMLVSGASTRAIAERLHVSPNTVRSHLQNIFKKLGVHSRLQAVAWANRHRLTWADDDRA